MDELTLRPIGIVHSSVGMGGEMPIEGVAAQVYVHADYAEGLHDVAEQHAHSCAWLAALGVTNAPGQLRSRKACSG